MTEKVERLGIILQDDCTYTVAKAGAVLVSSQGLATMPLFWPSPALVQQILHSWDQYEYFIDQDGDLSRKPQQGEE